MLNLGEDGKEWREGDSQEDKAGCCDHSSDWYHLYIQIKYHLIYFAYCRSSNLSNSVLDVLNSPLHLSHYILALREYVFLILQLLPSHAVHAFDASPVGGHFFLELLDARHYFAHDALCFGFDGFLELLHLFSKAADLRLQALGVEAGLLIYVLVQPLFTFKNATWTSN